MTKEDLSLFLSLSASFAPGQKKVLFPPPSRHSVPSTSRHSSRPTPPPLRRPLRPPCGRTSVRRRTTRSHFDL